jgi:hypothetical protein
MSLPQNLSLLRPIVTGSRDFDSETAIWDSVAPSYNWRRLANVLHRQRKGSWEFSVGLPFQGHQVKIMLACIKGHVQ